MRRAFVSLTLLVALSAQTDAQQGAARRQPTASTMAEQSDDGAPHDPARAAAIAQQNDFDRRIKQKSERAVRSICAGCDKVSVSARPRKAPQRKDAETVTDETDDAFAAEAPDGVGLE